MSTSMESVRVVIFGVEYSIKADVDIETTRQIARYVNSKMAEIHENTASRDHMKIAVMSALNIAGEYFEYKAKYEEGARKLEELQEKLASLSKKVDGVLGC
ncbi:MAG: cell division protein ZapA [Fibrobacter sp.]|nr:cell division protein ZapA [Fibrobacter sp.]